MITRKAFFKSIGLTLASIPLVGFLKPAVAKAKLPNILEASRGNITVFTQETVLTVSLTDQLLIKHSDGAYDLNRYGNIYQFIAQAVIPQGPKIMDAKVCRFESQQFELANVDIRKLDNEFRAKCVAHIRNPENIKQMNKINSIPQLVSFA